MSRNLPYFILFIIVCYQGGTNPDYVVTADDVDKLISVECVPMDENGHQVFCFLFYFFFCAFYLYLWMAKFESFYVLVCNLLKHNLA